MLNRRILLNMKRLYAGLIATVVAGGVALAQDSAPGPATAPAPARAAAAPAPAPAQARPAAHPVAARPVVSRPAAILPSGINPMGQMPHQFNRYANLPRGQQSLPSQFQVTRMPNWRLRRLDGLADGAQFATNDLRPRQPRLNQPIARTGERTDHIHPGDNGNNGRADGAATTDARPNGGPGVVGMPDAPTGGARDGTPTVNGSPDNGSQGLTPATFHRPRRGDPVVPFHNNGSVDFADACRRHHNGHDRDWWCHNFSTIILIGGGYYAWDAGWWYPAYGYDAAYTSYSYDGPIYGYDGLPPDQVIANVQSALQELGYFPYAVDGVLGPATREAITAYQTDNGLLVTGAIDRPTLVSLGFIL